MDAKEFEAYQKRTQPKVYAESTQKKWRAQVVKAIEEAIASGGDIKAAIEAAYPFDKRDCTRVLIWLQERRKALEKLGLLD
jgi:hypothetical protein